MRECSDFRAVVAVISYSRYRLRSSLFVRAVARQTSSQLGGRALQCRLDIDDEQGNADHRTSGRASGWGELKRENGKEVVKRNDEEPRQGRGGISYWGKRIGANAYVRAL